MGYKNLEARRKYNRLWMRRKHNHHERIPFPESFWRRVEKTPTCWLWTARRRGYGYGYMTVNYRNESAHRISYRLCVGLIPTGVSVLHHCDVPTCVRPEHLYLGSPKDNGRDKASRGRSLAGEQNPNARLKRSSVLEILQASLEGVTQPMLAKKHGVGKTTIWNILHGRAWKSVQRRDP